MKVVSGKLIGYHSNVQWATAKTNALFNFPTHMSTISENLVKISAASGICRFFCHIVRKV